MFKKVEREDWLWDGEGWEGKIKKSSYLKLGPMRPSDHEWRQAARQRTAGHFLLRAPGLRFVTLVPWRVSPHGSLSNGSTGVASSCKSKEFHW